MAITLADNGLVQTNTIAMNSSAGVGDLIFAATQSYPSDSGGLSDTLNGTYHALDTFTMGDGEELALYYIVVNTAGTATINAAGANVDRTGFARFTGFVNGAIIITGDAAANGNVGSSLASTSFNASKNNEYAFAIIGGDGVGSSGGFSFTLINASNYLATFWDGPVSSGNAVQITGTFNSSTTWGVIVQGFYDGSSAGTITWLWV